MGNWGSENFNTQRPEIDYAIRTNPDVKNLFRLINSHPINLKQAMFAAASRGNVARKTWIGCAFNQAGDNVNKNVNSTASAMEAFGISEQEVEWFITIWDNLEGTDEECSHLLMGLIDKAGLFRLPGERANVVSTQVWEQKLSEFEALMEANQVPDEDIALSILDGSLAGV